MSYDLKIERLLDAPPELVFDTIVDPSAQEEINTGIVEGWSLRRWDIDLRVGGAWRYEYGPPEGEGPADVVTQVFTEVQRPVRLAYRGSMYVSQWERTVEYAEAITLEDQDGKTLFTLTLSEIESKADRDAFADGVPSYVDSLKRVVEARAAKAAR
jgi:uncharacterized protein YndB with AHSA1/START domain